MLPLVRTYVCISGEETIFFSENLACFVFLLPWFWDSLVHLNTGGILCTTQWKFEPKKWTPKENRVSISLVNQVECYYKQNLKLKDDVNPFLSASISIHFCQFRNCISSKRPKNLISFRDFVNFRSWEIYTYA